MGPIEAEMAGRYRALRRRMYDRVVPSTLTDEPALREQISVLQETNATLEAENKSLKERCEFLSRRWQYGPQTSAIVEAVSRAYGIPVKEIVSRARSRHIVIARQHAVWLLRKETGLSLPQIGRALGDRDHTTMIHGIKRHQRRIDNGEDIPFVDLPRLDRGEVR